jgi:hypothetical protein
MSLPDFQIGTAMDTITLYHKPARYSDQQTLNYKVVVGMNIDPPRIPEGPLVFDDSDLTRCVLPKYKYSRSTMGTVGGAGPRLYALMAACFTSQRRQCTSRDMAAAVLNCAPDELAVGRMVPPERIFDGNAYALVNTANRTIKHYAIGAGSGQILTYRRSLGIALLDVPTVINLWGAVNHGIIIVQRKV